MQKIENQKKKKKRTSIENTLGNLSKHYSAEEGVFKEEYAEELMKDESRFGVQTYSQAGVSFKKISETQGKITYSGLLSKSGAQNVVGVFGVGSNQQWENVSEMSLKNDNTGLFSANVPIEEGKNINFAFKDSSENWDNNSGRNYTFVN